MGNVKRSREVLPPWDMPSDPVKAVFWFFHWLLKVLVRLFWIAILGAVIYESIVNRLVGGIGTLLVGLGVWAGLAVALFLFTTIAGVSGGIAEIGRMQQTFMRSASRSSSPFYRFSEPPETEGKVVEGTVTDLDEERRKRRQE